MSEGSKTHDSHHLCPMRGMRFSGKEMSEVLFAAQFPKPELGERMNIN